MKLKNGITKINDDDDEERNCVIRIDNCEKKVGVS